MRIISKFFDYYDKGVAFGIDPKQVYVRETKDITLEYTDKELKNELFSIMNEMPNFDNLPYMQSNKISNGVIGFCGRAYPWWRVEINFGKGFNKTYYSVAAMTESINGNAFEDNVANCVLETSSNKVRQALSFQIKELRDNLAIFHARQYKSGRNFRFLRGLSPQEFAEKYTNAKLPDELFIRHNAPIMMVINDSRKNVLTLNPRLNDYNFITQFDPIAAFQEIAMYLGNNMAKQNDPSVNFTDDMKRDIAGFDKWSFRKEGKGKK